MIITKIKGGLGNQLFQYAVGRAVALHHKVPLKLDLTIFETYKLHNGYRLDQFAIHADIATKNEIINLKGGNNALFSALRKAGLIKRKSYLKEKRSSYFDSSVFKNDKSIIIKSGSFIVPTIFLMLLKLTPFLPPNDASVIDNNVVGTNAKFIPLMKIEAINPVTSQIIPPPIPIK